MKIIDGVMSKHSLHRVWKLHNMNIRTKFLDEKVHRVQPLNCMLYMIIELSCVAASPSSDCTENFTIQMTRLACLCVHFAYTSKRALWLIIFNLCFTLLVRNSFRRGARVGKAPCPLDYILPPGV